MCHLSTAFSENRSNSYSAVLLANTRTNSDENIPSLAVVTIIIIVITQDTRETVFLFQRLSIALQRGNAVSFLNTMNTE